MSGAAHYYARIEAAAVLPDDTSKIRELRQVLEQLFKKLTAGEKRAFSSLYARQQFVFDTMRVPGPIRSMTNGFRTFANKVTHEERKASPEEAGAAIGILCTLVHHFLGDAVPQGLQTRYTSQQLQSLSFPLIPKPPLIPSTRVLVGHIAACTSNANGYAGFLLHASDEAGQEMTISVQDQEHNSLSYLHSLLQPYQVLHITNLRQVGEQSNFYRTSSQSHMVIEPDLLLSISELAECFTAKCTAPLNYLVKKLTPQDYKEAAFQGNMVNALLDMVVREPQADFKDKFKEAVSEQVYQAAGYGKETLNKIFTTVKERHWPNLQGLASEVRQHKVRLEPAFLAPDFGIEGRLDLLVEYAGDNNRKDIYELKSGSAPFDNTTWINHTMQVVGYNMLLQSVFGKHRTGVSAIIYSAAQQNPVRHVTTTLALEWQLMAVRNQVVVWMMQLAANDYSVLSQIDAEAAAVLPSFSQANYQVFENLYTNAAPYAKAYYQAQLSFVVREWLNAKIGLYSNELREDDADGFAGLWLYKEAEKREAFAIIPGLVCEAYHATEGLVHFTISDPLYHNFRKGDTVMLYPSMKGGLGAIRHQVIKGRLDEISGNKLLVSLNYKQLDAHYFESHPYWVVEHDIYESNYWATSAQLLELLDPQSVPAAERLLGITMPSKAVADAGIVSDLNPNQCRIINQAFFAQDYFLIQGPPGTGKTSTIITRLVKELDERQSSAIMVVAFTNRAVDEIEARLQNSNISFLRLGSRQSASEQRLRDYCLSGDIGKARDYIAQHNVFLCTVATLNSRFGLLRILKPGIDTILVDEASQLTESQLAGLLMRYKKFILVGDQNQLPPVVAQHEIFCQSNNELLQQLDAQQLSGSLFERLMRKAKAAGWNHAFDMLTTHFRMHRDIAAIINPWYGYQLQPGTAIQSEPFTRSLTGEKNSWTALLTKGRLLFVPSPHVITSKYHEVEAQRVVSLLQAIREQYGEHFNPAQTVGVVTPWRTQIAHIRQLLAHDELLSKVNIETVERFQGSENDIIIVSLAIYHSGQINMMKAPGTFTYADPDGQSITTELDRKLLVTLSRARQQIILLADANALRGSKAYLSVLQKFETIHPDVMEKQEEVFT